MEFRRIEEGAFKIIGIASIALILSCLLLMVLTVVVKGVPALNWAMITQTPKGGFYLGVIRGVSGLARLLQISQSELAVGCPILGGRL